ncbi:ABC transporter permease [Candidatus Electrothrix sp.]|uniref:ABC transporter permease n=1 Tax=Candidatus Electrothrix sp. TaxID=2170559 RepID=UPI0040579C46
MFSNKKFPTYAIYYLIILILLYTPLVLLVVFSFNEGKTVTFPIKGLTLDWYVALFEAQDLLKAMYNSLIIGVFTSVVAVVLGTMAALATTRFSLPGRNFFLTAGVLPLIIPDLAMGVSLQLLFHWAGISLSLWTVACAHTMVNIPYVMLIVSPRLQTFQGSLEEASMDLGAGYWRTLFKITLPVCAPVLIAGFLYSFGVSIDEFDLAYFVTGTHETLPVYLYSQLRFPNRLPLVLALSAIIIAVSLVVLLFTEILSD